MKYSKARFALSTKVVLYSCAFVTLMYSAFFAANPQAFAATMPHSAPATAHPTSAWSGEIYPALNFLGCGTGWNYAFDPRYFESFSYAYTTGSQACSQAIWDDHQFTQNRQCSVDVFVPAILATAVVSYGLYRADGSLIARYIIDQNANSGLVWLPSPGFISGIHHVLISSNNGQSGTYMAAGLIQFYCY